MKALLLLIAAPPLLCAPPAGSLWGRLIALPRVAPV